MSAKDSFNPDPTSPIKSLWDVQEHALEKYDSLRKEKQLQVELPTGSGKSVIGLLILESWRKQRKRCAIITSSTALCYELRKVAGYLRIPAGVILGQSTQEEGEHIRNTRAYSRCQSIGIFNYWSYMLTRDFQSAEYLVIDDADFFDNYLNSYYQIAIDENENPVAFSDLKSMIANIPLYKSRLDELGVSKNSEDYLLLYFPHSIKVADRLVQLSKTNVVRGNVQFQLRRNYEAIQSYLCFIATDHLVFLPMIPPSRLLDRLAEPKQIVLMSATLGSDEITKRGIGFEGNLPRISQDEADSVSTMGSRLIFPLDGLSSTNEISLSQIEALRRITQEFGKELVLCTSIRQAETYSAAISDLANVSRYQSEADLETFKKSGSGALVSGGRYIGLDLPGETCRVEVVPRLPFVLGPIDVLLRDILGDQEIINERTAHRIVQALGRCNRAPDDFAVYYVLDSRLAQDVRSLGYLSQFFPKQMVAELDEGQVICEKGGLTAALEKGKAFLGGEWSNLGKVIQGKAKGAEIPRAPRFERPVDLEVEYVRRACLQDFEGASRIAESISKKTDGEGIEVRRYKNWWLYLAAWEAYMANQLHSSEQALDECRNHLAQVALSADNSYFSGVRLVLNEIEKKESSPTLVEDYYTRLFKERVIRTVQDYWRAHKSIEEATATMKGKLKTGTHEETKQQLMAFLELTGFEVRDISKMVAEPDLLAFGNEAKLLLLIEIKTSKDSVDADAVDQVGGHKQRYETMHPGYMVIPLVFASTENVSEAASKKATGRVKIILVERFLPLVSRYFEAFNKVQQAQDATERGAVMSLIPPLSAWLDALSLEKPAVAESRELLAILPT